MPVLLRNGHLFLWGRCQLWCRWDRPGMGPATRKPPSGQARRQRSKAEESLQREAGGDSLDESSRPQVDDSLRLCGSGSGSQEPSEQDFWMGYLRCGLAGRPRWLAAVNVWKSPLCHWQERPLETMSRPCGGGAGQIWSGSSCALESYVGAP